MIPNAFTATAYTDSASAPEYRPASGSNVRNPPPVTGPAVHRDPDAVGSLKPSVPLGRQLAPPSRGRSSAVFTPTRMAVASTGPNVGGNRRRRHHAQRAGVTGGDGEVNAAHLQHARDGECERQRHVQAGAAPEVEALVRRPSDAEVEVDAAVGRRIDERKPSPSFPVSTSAALEISASTPNWRALPVNPPSNTKRKP